MKKKVKGVECSIPELNWPGKIIFCEREKVLKVKVSAIFGRDHCKLFKTKSASTNL